MPEYWDRFLGAGLDETDADVAHIIALEEERQARRIILIPSESMAPAPVRAALGSVFNNIYAEGYPPRRMTLMDEDQVLDFAEELGRYRRYGDRRFYKGADYVNFVEALAQRRCAALFANERMGADRLFVNVQPLSGAAANLAVYDALMRPGDTLMGMDLYMGGHLTHGSEFNISGRRYKVASYGVGHDGQLDYDQIMERALETRPKLIIAGYTSYPWAPDWEQFRRIADASGAYLMADIAHPAGLVVAGAYPSPVGLADVITFTTHKTMCGPRGAVILTHREELARKIDMAVFPGAQGGPHTNKFAAMAVAFRIASTDAFKRLMFRVVENARALAQSLERRGLGLAYDGTDTHLLVVDLRAIDTPTGQPLRGEVAVRIMELAGLVANKNTIPGDRETALASGVRLGTPWVTQRGMGPAEMDAIADAIARLLTGIRPLCYQGLRRELPRGKIAFDLLEDVKGDVANLASRSVAETASLGRGYPHYQMLAEPPTPAGREPVGSHAKGLLLVSGQRARPFLQEATTGDVVSLGPGGSARALVLDGDGALLSDVHLLRLEADERGRDRYVLVTAGPGHERVKAWLRSLSDGYVLFDRDDVHRKVQGPVMVRDLDLEPEEQEVQETALAFRQSLAGVEALPAGSEAPELYRAGHSDLFRLTKPYFVGQAALRSVWPPGGKEEFQWREPEEASSRRTPLFEEHRKLGGRMITFAGWEMPVWYSSVGEEHRAVRQAAGLFDVAHMGVLEVSGPNATDFLDLVSSNYVRRLEPGQSQYSYLLDPDADVIDDIMVYCRERDRYLLVVNAANAQKDWAWLNAVNEGRVIIDRDKPAMEVPGQAVLRDLRDPACGEYQRIDIALQGPASLATLQTLADDPEVSEALARLRRTELMEVELAGMDLIIARTGYTGEDIAYEIFVHPDRAVELWRLLLEVGAKHGVKPCGLAARDSTRVEAGLPLYGHELAGPLDIIPQEAGFPSYLKLHKAFFVGRTAVMKRAAASTRQLVRFRVEETGVRALRGGVQGEAVVNKRGAYIGRVTSAALVEGVQVGLALVDRRYSEPGAPLAIFPAGRSSAAKPPSELGPGDSVVLPIPATVLPRFPGR